MSGFQRLLKRLALDRPELRAWAMYDWANSAMYTLIVTAVFPIYFLKVAAKDLPQGVGEARFSGTTTIALALIALTAPILGAIADRRRCKKPLLGIFIGLGIAGCLGMWFVREGDWFLGCAMFLLANVGAAGSFVFYDSLLPHVARRDELDRLSTSGFALGYIGGGLFLAAALAVIQKPEWFGLPSGEGLTPDQASLPTRIALVTVGAWWFLFSIPLFRGVREPEIRAADGVGGRILTDALSHLWKTLKELGRFRQAMLLLIAFLIYNDGIATIIRMATLYGSGIGIAEQDLVTAILMVQFVGIPFTFLFGMLAGRIGAKRSILIGVAIYLLIGLLAWQMTTKWHFYLLAFMVAMVQGGTQGLSRSLFASMVPRQRSAEFFGLFAILDRFAGIAGPFIFFLVVSKTGNARMAILPVVFFFLIGGAILLRVNVAVGRKAALEAEEELG